MLKHGEPNPLNVFGLRQLEHCPPHFIQITFEIRTSTKQVTDWIYENLESRFWIGDVYYQTEGGSIAMSTCVAFENPGEASMFDLMLDQINDYNAIALN
jgi:hypothetical protein